MNSTKGYGRYVWLLWTLLTLGPHALGQKSPDAVPWAKGIKDPVTSIFRSEMGIYRRRVVSAAEAMPSEKYTFRPSFQKTTFAEIVTAVAENNFESCAVAGGLDNPQSKGLTSSGDKAKLVAVLKSSFEFCEKAFSKLHDNQLGEVVFFTREMMAERAGTLFALIGDWADSYRLAAVYFQLNGLEPPN